MATIKHPGTDPSSRPAPPRSRSGDLAVLGFLFTASVVVLAVLAAQVS